MKKTRFPRLFAIILTVALLLAPAAQALTVEQARALLSTYYVDPVSQDVLSQSTVASMLDSLGDPYTNYFTAEDYDSFSGTMSDSNTVGIGIVFRNVEDGMLISSIIADSPAEKAGLKAGDRITHVDSRNIVGVKNSVITALVTGKEGTELQITYVRDGIQKTVSMKRAAISVPMTTTSLLDGHVGYIDCNTFGPETLQHFSEGVAENRDSADRWIVDLTGNSGGELGGVIEPLGLFLGNQPLSRFRNSKGQYSTYRSSETAKTMYPVIVSTDGVTASASELFTAAIRDYGQGIVVGGRTFGKGVAQNVFNEDNMPLIFEDGSAMTITTARFFSPEGTTNDTVGVIPHLLVPDQYASAVSYLLSASEPRADNKNMVRLDMTWRWYLNLDTALSAEYKPAFIELLQAIPPDVRLMVGAGGDRWQSTTAAALAAEHGLKYQPRTFTDTADSPYGKKIDVLATYKLLGSDGVFYPENVLTRGDLCSMLAQALQCRVPNGSTQFSDVSMDASYGPAVNALANMGLVSGTGKGLFQPDAPVDHQQFISIMSRVAQRLNLYLYEDAKNMPKESATLAGLIPFDGWVRPDVWLLSSIQKNEAGATVNLLWDSLSNINPDASTTRGEAAALLYNVLSYTGVLPERVPQVNY